MEMEISGIRKCFDGAGPDSVNLSIGQPDFDTPQHIKDAAVKAIEQGYTGYTPNFGIPQLQAAISEKLRRENGLDYSPGQVMVTSGASEAIFLAIKSTVGHGEEVIVPNPGFLSYAALAKAVGAKPVGVSLDHELRLDPDHVSENINDRTRAIVVNSPGNPTGAVQSRDQLHALADLAEDHDIALISDEVYEHFIYEGEHVSPALYSDNVITINAVSKTYAMTGWRLGYVAASPDVMESMLKIHQVIQACACSISQFAALAALTGPQDCVVQMRETFWKRRDVMVRALLEMGIDIVVPKGAFYLFPRVGDGDLVASRLTSAGVITVPGSAFGSKGREHIRISYAASDQSIAKALDRMKKILR